MQVILINLHIDTKWAHISYKWSFTPHPPPGNFGKNHNPYISGVIKGPYLSRLVVTGPAYGMLSSLRPSFKASLQVTYIALLSAFAGCSRPRWWTEGRFGGSVVFRGCFFLQKPMKLGFGRDPGKTNKDFNRMLLVGVVAAAVLSVAEMQVGRSFATTSADREQQVIRGVMKVGSEFRYHN